MKKLIALILLVVPTVALADVWILASSGVAGIGEMACTYRSPNGQYETTIIVHGGCPYSINR